MLCPELALNLAWVVYSPAILEASLQIVQYAPAFSLDFKLGVIFQVFSLSLILALLVTS